MEKFEINHAREREEGKEILKKRENKERIWKKESDKK
jgi:hypothetical protein